MSVYILCYHEKIWFQNCLFEFKPVIYIRYVDDTFVLFLSKHHIKRFSNYINRQHKNIRFTYETEHDHSASFRNIKISRENSKFMTLVHQKSTFSGVFANFCSSNPKSYKYSMLFTLLYKAFKLCSNFECFNQEIDKLKTIFELTVIPKFLLVFVLKST